LLAGLGLVPHPRPGPSDDCRQGCGRRTGGALLRRVLNAISDPGPRRCPPVLGTLPAGAAAWPSAPLPDPCQEDAVTTMNALKPGDALFHGTSTPRWQSIQQDGALRLPSSGYRKISLTTDRSVAEYWAKLAPIVDRKEGRGDGPGVILVLSHSALETGGHWLTEFSDDVWGAGECDWEREVACWSEIDIAQVMVAQSSSGGRRGRRLRAAAGDRPGGRPVLAGTNPGGAGPAAGRAGCRAGRAGALA